MEGRREGGREGPWADLMMEKSKHARRRCEKEREGKRRSTRRIQPPLPGRRRIETKENQRRKCENKAVAFFYFQRALLFLFLRRLNLSSVRGFYHLSTSSLPAARRRPSNVSE